MSTLFFVSTQTRQHFFCFYTNMSTFYFLFLHKHVNTFLFLHKHVNTYFVSTHTCQLCFLFLHKHVNTLLFADDQVLITQEYEDMEFMVRKLLENYEKWGMKINFEKKNFLHGLWSRNQRFSIGRSERLH